MTGMLTLALSVLLSLSDSTLAVQDEKLSGGGRKI